MTSKPVAPSFNPSEPLSLHMQQGAASAQDLSNRDLHYYNKWSETKNPRDMARLIDSMKPIILKEVNRASGTLSNTTLMAEGKKWAIHGVKTWDPNGKASLSTHVTNWLQKVRRLNYEYQNAARLPEALNLQHGKFTEATNNFKEQFDREPTEEELAKLLGWSKKQVLNFQNRLFSDLAEGANENPSLATKSNEGSLFIEHLKLALDPVEHEMFFNPGNLSVGDLAKKLNISMSRYQYLRDKLRKKIEGMQHDFHR